MLQELDVRLEQAILTDLVQVGVRVSGGYFFVEIFASLGVSSRTADMLLVRGCLLRCSCLLFVVVVLTIAVGWSRLPYNWLFHVHMVQQQEVRLS